jgi:hypothetical protein
LFGFCRVLRGRPEFGGLEAKAALAKVRVTLKLHGTSLDELFPECDDTAIYFLSGWKHTDLIGLLIRAVRSADAEPQPSQHAVSAGYSRFCLICKHLQLVKGSEPFILAVETFAAILRVDRRTITRYKRQAEDEGLLKLASPANHLNHIAAQYKYSHVP